MENKKTLLKVLVGSQAHGLATPKSDFDYRGVFIVPTHVLFEVNNKKVKNTSWIEGHDDDTSWEFGHFMRMASKCNPTVLETFLAPVIAEESNPTGYEIQSLFKYVWNSKQVCEAFIGYGLNQRKKFLDEKDARPDKYAVAYLRTLYQAWELLRTGKFTVKISETDIGDTLKAWKKGHYEIGEVIQFCVFWEKKVRQAYEKNPDKQTNFDIINDFVARVRKEYWYV